MLLVIIIEKQYFRFYIKCLHVLPDLMILALQHKQTFYPHILRGATPRKIIQRHISFACPQNLVVFGGGKMISTYRVKGMIKMSVLSLLGCQSSCGLTQWWWPVCSNATGKVIQQEHVGAAAWYDAWSSYRARALSPTRCCQSFPRNEETSPGSRDAWDNTSLAYSLEALIV